MVVAAARGGTTTAAAIGGGGSTGTATAAATAAAIGASSGSGAAGPGCSLGIPLAGVVIGMVGAAPTSPALSWAEMPAGGVAARRGRPVSSHSSGRGTSSESSRGSCIRRWVAVGARPATVGPVPAAVGRCRFGRRLALPRVLDAAVVRVADGLAQRVADPPQVAHRQARLVELAEVQLAVDDALHERVDRRVVGLLQRARRRLDRVADREDRGLAALRRMPGIAEVLDGEPARVALLLALAPEVLEHPVAVVHVHEVDDALVQPAPPRQRDALGDVREDRVARHLGRQLIVRAGLAGSRFSMKYFGCSDLPRS